MGDYQVYWQKHAYNNGIFFHLGVDLHAHSKFYARSYMPIHQQFYLQNQFEIGGYPVVDAFFNFKIRNYQMFFKVTNLLQGIVGKGYYVTPGYLGQGRQVEFGLKWQFFD